MKVDDNGHDFIYLFTYFFAKTATFKFPYGRMSCPIIDVLPFYLVDMDKAFFFYFLNGNIEQYFGQP